MQRCVFCVCFWLSIVYLLQVSGIHNSCERNFYKLGCFIDKRLARTMQHLLITDRASKPSENRMDWKNWNGYIHSLACRCAEEARSKNYTMFGLQYYGECWSGPSACQSYSKYGGSSHCIGQNYTDCDLDDDSECVGKANANFVYLLLEEPDTF